MKFNLKQFIVFALIIFFGGMIGNYVNAAAGFTGSTDILMRTVSFLVPTSIIYFIWVNWGKKTAE